MPSITIDGKVCEFTPGQTILQVANAHGVEIPQYCYHDAMSVVASCRICLAEVWAPNPRNDNKLEPIPKLLPTCQAQASDGQVVYTDSPRSVANQKAVMEYLLINHPLDCPVCDQSGECYLQDYSYQYGRSVSRFEESKVKQPKKDLGPNVLLYADRCIMCSRCVRFTREITETNELIVEGRGNTEQIDIFPGVALDNALASNVIDLCPVGALLDKDFLFTKRVWDLTMTPSIDPLTASGDNISLEHADDRVYRLKPRVNMDVNKWWITDEVRYGWKFVHSDDRVAEPMRRRHGALVTTEWSRALHQTVEGFHEAVSSGKRLALLVSPMLTCEDAYHLATAVLGMDAEAVLGVGPVPVEGEDRVFPPSAAADDPRRFVQRAEKAPNARGVRRVLEALAGGRPVHDFNGFLGELSGGAVGGALITGGYPSDWATPELRKALERDGLFVALSDVLMSPLVDLANTVLPGASWAEKAGTFENCTNRLQAFEQGIRPVGEALPEAQIGIDLEVEVLEQTGQEQGAAPRRFNAGSTRSEMADRHDALRRMVTDVHLPARPELREPDMEVVEL